MEGAKSEKELGFRKIILVLIVHPTDRKPDEGPDIETNPVASLWKEGD